MTRLIERVSTRVALVLIVVGFVIVGGLIWRLQTSSSNTTQVNNQQTAAISQAARAVSRTQGALQRANVRLRALGQTPVQVPSVSVPGVTGATGARGPRGVPGRSITGRVGPAGPAGRNGNPGTNTTGATGPRGLRGARGPAGTDGKDSIVPGPAGPAGPAGRDGTDGKDGKDGKDGQEPQSFTFTETGPLGTSTTYVCRDPDDDGNYDCQPTT